MNDDFQFCLQILFSFHQLVIEVKDAIDVPILTELSV